LKGQVGRGLRRVLRPFRNHRAYRIAQGAWRGVLQARKADARTDHRIASLEPAGVERGRVLIAYQVDGFFGDEISLAHTQDWESVAMAETWAELGFRVDVVWNGNLGFMPTKKYDYFVAARMALEPIGARLNPDCIKILHADTAHWLYSNAATHRRALEFQRRKGVTPRKLLLIDQNRAVEEADFVTMLGNAFTESTYAYAGKKIRSVPISTLREFDRPRGKDFQACRTRFVWFGSRGSVHKGLDRVLEAFARSPELHLTVMGPINDPDFLDAYRKDLFDSPNVETLGWVDLSGPDFPRVAGRTVALVFPSCAEGQSGSVVQCLHAGLIPIVSRESGVDVPGFGITLETSSVGEIQDAVRRIASRPPEELEAMAHAAWEYARKNHTREVFRARYREAVAGILDECGSPGEPAVGL
jgi:glycosyltransferase involved in cell wall biosynthesis